MRFTYEANVVFSGFVGGLAMDGYYVVKPFTYNRIKNQILPQGGN